MSDLNTSTTKDKAPFRPNAVGRLASTIAVAACLAFALHPSVGRSQTILNGTSGSYSYPSSTCNTGVNSYIWYQPSAYGAGLPAYYCTASAVIYTSPTTYSGSIIFTVGPVNTTLVSGASWYMNKSSGTGEVGGVAGWYPASLVNDRLTCADTMVGSGATSTGPAPGGGWFLQDQVVGQGQATINVLPNTSYCIVVAYAEEEATGAEGKSASISYSLTWTPGPPEGPTDGPLPVWAYGVLGLAMLLIARRQLSFKHSRS